MDDSHASGGACMRLMYGKCGLILLRLTCKVAWLGFEFGVSKIESFWDAMLLPPSSLLYMLRAPCILLLRILRTVTRNTLSE